MLTPGGYHVERNMSTAEVDLVLHLLDFCSVHPGAKIIITVEHDNGCRATANLYDHAALNQGLCEALNYYQTQL